MLSPFWKLFSVHLLCKYITKKTRLFKYIENFLTKNWKFSDKNSDIFLISAQNINCGYSLEPPRQGWKLKMFRRKSNIFHISAQNKECGYTLQPPRRGGSNEYLQSMFLSRNKKNNVYSCKPQFCYTKLGFKGSKLYRFVFVIRRIKYLSDRANVQAWSGSSSNSAGYEISVFSSN